jgi:hypothetical protein
VAQETNTNQHKQKKYAKEISVAKTEASTSKVFALEGRVTLKLPECSVCSRT